MTKEEFENLKPGDLVYPIYEHNPISYYPVTIVLGPYHDDLGDGFSSCLVSENGELRKDCITIPEFWGLIKKAQ